MLHAAIKNEVDEYIQTHASLRDEKGRRLVVRNGYLPERESQTPVGNVSIRQPRVDDRRPGQKFLSPALAPFIFAAPPAWMRSFQRSTFAAPPGDFTEALTSLLGPNAAGPSPTNIVRLKEDWTKDFQTWSWLDLSITRSSSSREELKSIEQSSRRSGASSEKGERRNRTNLTSITPTKCLKSLRNSMKFA